MDSNDLIPLLLTAISGFFIAMMFSKIWVPFAKPPAGVEVHSTKLGFLQKVMVHRWHLLVVLGLANLGSIPGIEVPGIPPNALVLIILFVILIVVLPTRYRFTAEGFALGRGRIMPWKNFKRYRMGPGRIQFETKGENLKRVDIFVTNVQQQALRPVIKRYFRAGP